MSFFALTREELGGDADIVLVTGDAYVTELVPGIIDEETRSGETLNVRDYL